jgi:hypothetical protein
MTEEQSPSTAPPGQPARARRYGAELENAILRALPGD